MSVGHAEHQMGAHAAPVSRPGAGEATAKYEGQTYYFCARGCKKAFDSEPQTYLDPNYKPSI